MKIGDLVYIVPCVEAVLLGIDTRKLHKVAGFNQGLVGLKTSKSITFVDESNLRKMVVS